MPCSIKYQWKASTNNIATEIMRRSEELDVLGAASFLMVNGSPKALRTRCLEDAAGMKPAKTNTDESCIARGTYIIEMGCC